MTKCKLAIAEDTGDNFLEMITQVMMMIMMIMMMIIIIIIFIIIIQPKFEPDEPDGGDKKKKDGDDDDDDEDDEDSEEDGDKKEGKSKSHLPRVNIKTFSQRRVRRVDPLEMAMMTADMTDLTCRMGRMEDCSPARGGVR